jgi:Lipoprotein LpqB beta-propeller domain
MTVALDERLRRAIEHAGEPADPSGVYEGLIRRRERRRIRRRVGSGVLALAVVAGTTAGVFALSKLFGGLGEDEVTPLVPVTPTGAENGLVAFTTGDRIIVQAADGSDPHEVPAPAPGLAWHIAWSPDGTRLAVAVFDGPRRSLWVMRADGSEAFEIADGENVSRPSWHPNGALIAYSLERNGRTEVHVTRSDGTNDRVVYSEPAPGTYAVFSATFSPDGSRIVFDAGTDSEYNIFVMASDGSIVRQLTEKGTDYNPAWSPDGSRIVFIRYEEISESDVFVMEADGSDVRRLTEHGARFTNIDPQFSPDGAFITYGSAENGVVGLSIIALATDGSDPEVLVEGEVLGFSWQPLPTIGATVAPSPRPSGNVDGEDIGLGFPVCNVTSVAGVFAPGVDGTAWVATRIGDVGCPSLGDGMQVVAVDVSGDGVADTSFGPLQCDPWCSAFAAPDVDGDGTDELLIQNIQFSIAGLRLYDVGSDPQPTVMPVTVASPGYPGEGLAPGAEPQFWIGGDAFDSETLRCFEDQPPPTGPGRVLILTSASQVPPDSRDAMWHATETWFDLQPDGTVTIVDRGDFEEPVESGPPSFAQLKQLCGTRLPAPFGG